MDILLHLPDQLVKQLTALPDYNNFAATVLQGAVEEQAKLDHYHRAKIQEGIQAAKAGQFAKHEEVAAFFDQWQ